MRRWRGWRRDREEVSAGWGWLGGKDAVGIMECFSKSRGRNSSGLIGSGRSLDKLYALPPFELMNNDVS